MGTAARLLVVDDDDLNRDMLRRRLQRSGYQVEVAEDGRQALALLESGRFDLVLLDNMMPGMSGIEVLERLRQNLSASELPVIMVTAQCESDNVVRALQLGANDYITKPVDIAVAVARIETQLVQRSDFATQRTIDSLTSLPNRAWLEEELRRINARGQPCRLLVLEPDHHHYRTEESLGPDAFGRLMNTIAARLRDLAQNLQAQAVRCGNHHFALLLAGDGLGVSGPDLATRVAAVFGEPLSLDGMAVFLNPAMGLASRQAGDRSETLLQDAYAAVRYARQQGAGRCEVFHPDMRVQDLQSLRLENDLWLAVEREEWVVYYQPKVNLQSGEIEGCEALVRWNRPGHGLVMPSDFIAVAERSGAIVALGRQVLDRACRDMVALRASFPNLTVSVNVSGRQFSEPDLVEQIQGIIAATGLPPTALRLEVTETSVMANPSSAQALLKQLRHLGVGIKLDDFGTGYSSLAYLQQFPFDTLKIDRSLVEPLAPGTESAAIVETIIALARTLNMQVVAEGIETPQQLKLLQQLGCQYGQGFWFSRPVDLKHFRALLDGWIPAALHFPPQPASEELCPNCY
jgi:EAL domain-containing protein (putative c-di-GMP-specific phosphodiesterase class I)/DNA-binding NarL/FixJ family response regulator